MARNPPLIAALFDPYLPQLRDVMHGLVDYTTEQEPGWELVFTSLAAHGTRSREPVTLSRFDGFIDSHPTPRVLRHIRDRPSVLLEESLSSTNIPIVSTGMARVGRDCAEHLIGSGLRHLAVVTSPPPEREPDRLRREGFTAVMQERSLGEPRVFQGGQRMADRAEWSWEDQVDDLADWLGQQPRPLGIMPVDIAYGWRTFAATQHAGLRIPEDVCIIVGGDDELILGGLRPAVSGVAYNQKQVGYRAAATLHRVMQGQPVPAITRIDPLGVMERQSTLFTASEDPIVEQAMRLIWQRVEDGLTVRDLVQDLPVSQRTLVRRFEQALGRTPYQEIRRSQLQAARRLLTTTDLPLSEVAVRSGLGTASNLSQAVRRTAGISPAQLRRQHR